MTKKEKLSLEDCVKVDLEKFLYNTFIDLPQTLGIDINEAHGEILTILLTETMLNHQYYIRKEE